MKNHPYQSLFDLRETERLIRTIKEYFQTHLAQELGLLRVSAPLFVLDDTGVNDNLNGIEKPVSFPVKSMNGKRAEIVQSLAKWKRMALANYGFKPGEGIYTDMNAIRPDEVVGPVTLDLCGSVGLGTRHLARRAQCRFPSHDRREDLRRDSKNRGAPQ